MKELFTALGAITVLLLTVFGLAVFSGTVLWMIYPHIHSLFSEPTILAERLSWWDSVCITWIFYILIKSTNTNNCKD